MIKNLSLKIGYLETDENGEEKTRYKTYSNLKPEAEDQAIYEVGQTIAGLQKKDLGEICSVTTKILSGE